MVFIFLKIKMKHFPWEKKINRMCLNKWIFLFFYFPKRKTKKTFCWEKSIPSLMGWLSPCLHRLMLLCSQPLFPGRPAELVPQRMPPGSLPLSTAQKGSSLPTPLTPIVSRVQCRSSHRTEARVSKTLIFPFPLSSSLKKYQSKHFVIIPQQFFLPIIAHLQCSGAALPGWLAGDESSPPNDLQWQLPLWIKAWGIWQQP